MNFSLKTVGMVIKYTYMDNYYSNNYIFSTFIIHTTKSSQQAVDGFLLPTPRNISSDVTFCLNNISYLKKILSKSVNIPHFCKSTQSKKW